MEKEIDDKQEKSASSGVHGEMSPLLVQLKDVKPFHTNCAGSGKESSVRPDDVDESEALRRELGTVQQLLEKSIEIINQRRMITQIMVNERQS